MNDKQTIEGLCRELNSAIVQLTAMQGVLVECAKMVLRENYKKEQAALAEE